MPRFAIPESDCTGLAFSPLCSARELKHINWAVDLSPRSRLHKSSRHRSCVFNLLGDLNRSQKRDLNRLDFHQIEPNLQKHSLFSWTIWTLGRASNPRKTAVKNENLLLRGNPALVALLTVRLLLDSSTYWLKSVATERGRRDVARPAARLPKIPLIFKRFGSLVGIGTKPKGMRGL